MRKSPLRAGSLMVCTRSSLQAKNQGAGAQERPRHAVRHIEITPPLIKVCQKIAVNQRAIIGPSTVRVRRLTQYCQSPALGNCIR